MTDLRFKLPAARLKVLNIKVINWNICKQIYQQLQVYHVCAGRGPGVFNEGPCDVCNHFTHFFQIDKYLELKKILMCMFWPYHGGYLWPLSLLLRVKLKSSQNVMISI